MPAYAPGHKTPPDDAHRTIFYVINDSIALSHS
jgi:hypothetical protein